MSGIFGLSSLIEFRHGLLKKFRPQNCQNCGQRCSQGLKLQLRVHILFHLKRKFGTNSLKGFFKGILDVGIFGTSSTDYWDCRFYWAISIIPSNGTLTYKLLTVAISSLFSQIVVSKAALASFSYNICTWGFLDNCRQKEKLEKKTNWSELNPLHLITETIFNLPHCILN